MRRPVRKEKIVTRREGRERRAKESCVGERERATGVDFVCRFEARETIRQGKKGDGAKVFF